MYPNTTRPAPRTGPVAAWLSLPPGHGNAPIIGGGTLAGAIWGGDMATLTLGTQDRSPVVLHATLGWLDDLIATAVAARAALALHLHDHGRTT